MGDNQFTIIDGGSIIMPRGFKAAGLHCGLKKTDRNDLGIILCDVPAVAAAVYTTNLVQAAPLKVTRESLQDGKLRAIVVNSGNANAAQAYKGKRTPIRCVPVLQHVLASMHRMWR